MKHAILLILLSVVFSYLPAQNADSTWIVANYGKSEHTIKMRDGVMLFTTVYAPKDASEAHPILMKRTPYSCAPYGKEFKPFWNSYVQSYLKESYILVIQDVRGRWMSEGEFMDVRPFNATKKKKETDEASDTYDTIEWLLKNIPNNSKKVGVFGVSYPGFYSTMAAASNHPALLAVSPQAPVTNWFLGDDFHHNGVFFLMDAFSFYSAQGGGFGLPHPKPTMIQAPSKGFKVHDNYKFYLETGTLQDFAQLVGDSVKFWKDIFAHPDYDDWWKARDARNAMNNLNPAMLWVGGLFDAEDHWGAWNSYKAAEEKNPGKEFNKIVMGPWHHGQWGGKDGTHLGNISFGSNTSDWYQQKIEIPFFNYYLKGKGSIIDLAEATIFITGANEWKQFTQWPPVGIQEKKLYFHADGQLSWDKPTLATSASEYISDPAKPVPYTEDVHFNRTREYMTDDQRFASRRPDVLSFQTPVLTEEITVTGNVIANLFTQISTTDADFVVKLIDVFPDDAPYIETDIYSDYDKSCAYPMAGYQMLVHGEIFRGRYRNSFEKPEAFSPGKVELVTFKAGDVAHTFKKGHRIMIQIQSTWFPLADRNPQEFVNIYEAKKSGFRVSAIRILHDALNSSAITLPILAK